MFDCKRITGLVAFAAAVLLPAAILLTALPGSAVAAQHAAASTAPAVGEPTATPPEIAEFMALLADPKVQKWLIEQHPAQASHKPAPPAETVSHYVGSRVIAIREHFIALGGAFLDLPNQFERAVGLLQAEFQLAEPCCCSSSFLPVSALGSSGCFARQRRSHASTSTVFLWKR